MGIAEGGRRLVFLRKVRKIFQHVQQFLAEMAQTVPIKDQIPVIGYITACGPQMDHACGAGGRFSIGIDVRHHIMPYLSLPLCGARKINVIYVCFQLCDLLCRNGQAEIMLRPGQRGPEPSPDLNTLFLGE